jgi:DNA-binding transcriptional MerR regulator
VWNAIQTARLYQISRETVRQYSREFEIHLSPQANPGKSRTRMYNQDDMEVFALIVEMKGQGKLYSDIHASLMNGQRGQLPPEFNAIVSSDAPRYSQLQLRLTFIEDELKTAHKTIDKKDGQIELLTKQLEDTKEELRRIDRENAILKYRLDANIKD